MKQLILDIATINATLFFRDPKAFSAIENKLIPDILAKKGAGQELRVWSAAASTGQEAFSGRISPSEP